MHTFCRLSNLTADRAETLDVYKRQPLRHIPVAAVGGVTPENLLLFKKAGACAYGISTGIFNAAAIKSEDYEHVRLLAREYVRLAAQQD